MSIPVTTHSTRPCTHKQQSTTATWRQKTRGNPTRSSQETPASLYHTTPNPPGSGNVGALMQFRACQRSNGTQSSTGTGKALTSDHVEETPRAEVEGVLRQQRNAARQERQREGGGNGKRGSHLEPRRRGSDEGARARGGVEVQRKHERRSQKAPDR